MNSLDLHPETPMSEVLEKFPGAQRALFRQYHIGGCSSCGFQPSETLAQVCARNNGLPVEEVIQHIRTSHEQDSQILIRPRDLEAMRSAGGSLRLLDIRSHEEFEAARIEGAVHFTQSVMQEILSRWPREEPLVIYDHQGRQGLDAAAYFLGHGFKKVHCLQGGIDAWSREVDSRVPRYRLS